MRRNVKKLFKFSILVIVTITVTVLVFKIFKQFDHSNLLRGVAEKLHATSPMIDWHDYKFMKEELARSGPGEHGKPYKPTEFDRDLKESLYKVNGFNGMISDLISLNRSVPDIRHPDCKTKKYPRNLNIISVSVIVPFHNEHLSTLLRTAISVINRSPKQLLKEILLVDDCSSKEIVKEPLDKVVNDLFKDVIKVIRLPERVGLIRARLAGAHRATGSVLVFLDSHTEANVNWLPPLLAPIAENYKVCVCPFIDVIDFDTFEYRAQDEGARGAFDWEFFYKRLPLLPEDKAKPSEPFRSPVMAGGLFAISAQFFWELGGYDEGLDIWGGEQYELSFKIWQCGGEMLDAPCSRVGHIYRKFAPFPNPGRGDFVGKNYRRVAEVWMDEYAEYLYMRRPQYRKIDPGDLTNQKAIRTKLKCKPFKWFIEKIAFDLPLKYPPIEPPHFAEGEIQSFAIEGFCVDTEFKEAEKRFGLKECRKGGKGAAKGEQYFQMTWHKDVRPKGRSMCWDVSSVADKAPVSLFSCHGMKGNQLWRYDKVKKQLIHGGNPRCLEASPTNKEIFVTKCDENSVYQKWIVEIVNEEALNKWEKIGPQ